MTSLFVGVVSHERSRFAVSQGPQGLASQLAGGLIAAGVPVEVQVNTGNLHDPATHPVNESVVRESLHAQGELEDQWASYIGAPGTRATRIRSLAARSWRDAGNRFKAVDVSLVTRLVNIELSHLNLFDAGLASGAPWIVILEDDAMTTNVPDCVDGIAGLITRDSSAGYINLSHSFSLKELGIDHLLEPSAAQWQGDVDRMILSARRPVTNTVCAVMYRADFLHSLVATMRELPFYPVVPIDWRVNHALMIMVEKGMAGDGTAWFIEPGPIDQMSMR